MRWLWRPVRQSGAPWFVADLKRLPVQNAAADVVLNVFSPADYGEFRRVLTPDGELLKVVPGPDYLLESDRRSQAICAAAPMITPRCSPTCAHMRR